MSLDAEASAKRRMDELNDQLSHLDHTAEMKRLDAMEYQGRDPENLVTAVLTGDGTVARVLFAGSVSVRTAAQVEQAILAATVRAQLQADRARQEYLARVDALVADLTAAAAEYERIAVEAAAHRVREAYRNVA
jgi:DNA-binding protein YbaB